MSHPLWLPSCVKFSLLKLLYLSIQVYYKRKDMPDISCSDLETLHKGLFSLYALILKGLITKTSLLIYSSLL